MPEYKLCHACVGDVVLKREIRATGSIAQCYHCEGRRKTWPLALLAERIHGVLQANYRHTYPGPYDQYASLYPGDDATVTISEVALLDDADIGEDIRQHLSNRYGYSSYKDSGDDYYGEDDLLAFIPPSAEKLHLGWTEFCDLVKTRSRFFNADARDMLDEIFANLPDLKAGPGKPIIRTFTASRPTKFYRGRVATDEITLERILADPIREMASPPHDKATAGRMNGRGISLFYGALDPKTCLAELRPPVASYVVITVFENKRPLRLLDLQRLRAINAPGSMFAADFREKYELASFMSRLVNQLSRPIMPGSEEIDYLPTQAVAEYLAGRTDLNLDGLLFPSSQRRESDLNVVLFYPSSRVAGKPMPADCKTSMLWPRRTEEGGPDIVSISIHTPPKRRKKAVPEAWRYPSTFDDEIGSVGSGVDTDPRIQTLKWVPDSLEVRIVEEVEYGTSDHRVSRQVQRKRRRRQPKFRPSVQHAFNDDDLLFE